MRIAFYAPLKSPNHPVVSGDREVARLLIRALELAGYTVDIASELRAFLPQPDESAFAALRTDAGDEIARLRAKWRREPPPALWFTYHTYYKSPDLIGPRIAADLSIPYVTAEASYSGRRDIGAWAASQQLVAAAVRQAAVNLCLTTRDRDGLAQAVVDASLAMLPAFVDVTPFSRGPGTGDGRRLVTIAMMRPGDKLASYRALAVALRLIADLPWTLSVVGDGPCRAEVEALFAEFSDGRIVWHGQLGREAVADVLGASDIYIWPGCGEAFGLAYLEAQAAGLPVVAQATAGVPEVVRHGETGLLTEAGGDAAFAAAIARLLGDDAERGRLADGARRFVLAERSLEAAARRLAALLPHMVQA